MIDHGRHCMTACFTDSREGMSRRCGLPWLCSKPESQVSRPSYTGLGCFTQQDIVASAAVLERSKSRLRLSSGQAGLGLASLLSTHSHIPQPWLQRKRASRSTAVRLISPLISVFGAETCLTLVHSDSGSPRSQSPG